MNGDLQQILHNALLQLAVVAGPMLAALLIVGLLVGVLQAATQINDPAVGFVPRLAATLLVTWMIGRWMMEKLALGFAAAITSIAGG
jgi:flagellar biosynthesis protein FliQ